MEVYILTTQSGSERIRGRVHSEPNLSHLIPRLESILIVVPPREVETSAHDEDQNAMDIKIIPKLLYERLGMLIVNHDGGQKVLREFCKGENGMIGFLRNIEGQFLP